MGLLIAFWLVGELVVRFTGLPIPGGILGLFLALALLLSRRLSPASMRRGADWFLAEMLLFFVPAVPAVLDHREFLGLLGIKVVAVICCGTVVVMGVTACAVDLFCRVSQASGGEGHDTH
jgi:holin-like protein